MLNLMQLVFSSQSILKIQCSTITLEYDTSTQKKINIKSTIVFSYISEIIKS